MVAAVPLWSTTPASNTGLDMGANFPEGMAPSAVNDGMRGVQAAIRKLYNDGAGKIVAGGSANAITVATQSVWAALADGISVVFRAANTNTNATVTLALDGLTAKNCYHADGSALAVGDIVAGGIYIAAYATTANGGAGGWLILNAVSAVWSGAAAAEVTVASATTCDILGAASALVAISGTTTITSLGTGANRVRFVRFTGILTLTHNATSLILPGGANITTAAGDTMIVESDASSNVRVLAYQKADGTPVVNPSDKVKTVKQQTFTGSGTYTPSTGMLYCIIECWGGGGGGGGTAGSGTGGSGGGGGGAGGYSRKYATATDIGANKTVTIGAAGSAGSAGNNAGGTGGDTSVGSLCVGKGGSGGSGAATQSGAMGGAGGVAGTGDVTGTGAPGNPGGGGGSSLGISGNGGSSLVGGGGLGRGSVNISGGDGGAATGYGAGGGGGQNASSGTARAGGAGTAGYVVITEYCSQ